MLSKAYGVEDAKKLSVLSGINGSKGVVRMWKMRKEVGIQDCRGL
jgi:hypothetical protein